MKYFENSDLEDLALIISRKTMGMNTIKGKLEAFELEDVDFQGEEGASDIKINVDDSESGGNKAISGEEGVGASSSQSASGSSGPVQESKAGPIVGRKRSNSLGQYQSRRPQRKRSSSTGDLSEPSNQRLFTQLVASFGASFPDYDFSRIKAQQFKYQESKIVISQINNYLAELNYSHAEFLSKLWGTIDFIIDLHHCEIYSYCPAVNDELTFLEGSIWSFNYFFFNKDLMRICHFSCYAISNLRSRLNTDFMSNTDFLSMSESREFNSDDDNDDDDEDDDEDDDDKRNGANSDDDNIFHNSANDLGLDVEDDSQQEVE